MSIGKENKLYLANYSEEINEAFGRLYRDNRFKYGTAVYAFLIVRLLLLVGYFFYMPVYLIAAFGC